jgi:hypothetical protein
MSTNQPMNEGQAYVLFIEYLKRAYGYYDALNPDEIPDFESFNCERDPLKVEEVFTKAADLFKTAFPAFSIDSWGDDEFSVTRKREWVQTKFDVKKQADSSLWSVREKLADVLERNYGGCNFEFRRENHAKQECDLLECELRNPHFGFDTLQSLFRYWNLKAEEWIVSFDVSTAEKSKDQINPTYHYRIGGIDDMYIQIWLKVEKV